MAQDPNIAHLRQLVEHFRESEDETRRRRKILDEYIRALKQQGYSYPVLSRETGMALNTVQNIIDPSARKRGKKLVVAKPD